MSVVINTITKSAFTFGNIGLIQRILKNLMRNAIRFTPKGGSVTLSIRERFESIAVTVTDPGAEIAYNDIFQEYSTDSFVLYPAKKRSRFRLG